MQLKWQEISKKGSHFLLLLLLPSIPWSFTWLDRPITGREHDFCRWPSESVSRPAANSLPSRVVSLPICPIKIWAQDGSSSDNMRCVLKYWVSPSIYQMAAMSVGGH